MERVVDGKVTFLDELVWYVVESADGNHSVYFS